MFDDSRPSTIRINDIERANRLCEYLGRPSRQRPLAVATPKWGHDEPVTSAERLVGRGFDVAIVEPMSVLTRINERLPYELRIRQGGVLLLSSEGWIGESGLTSRYCFFDPGRPGIFVRALRHNVDEVLAAELAGGTDPAGAELTGAAPVPGTETGGTAPASASRSQSPQLFSPGALTVVEDETTLDALAGYILDKERRDSVVVVSKASSQERPFVGCEELVRRLEETAVVAYVPLASLTWRLSSYLSGEGVYGGAARLYPPGGEAAAFDDRYLYLAYDHDAGPRVIDRVVADAMDLAVYDFTGEVRENSELRAATARVQQVLTSASCALGTLGGGQYCSVFVAEVERLFGIEGLRADRVFVDGMELRGKLDPRRRTLVEFAEPLKRTAEDALRGYRDGMTVLARVAAVSERQCSLELFPGFAVTVEAADVAGAEVRPDDVLGVSQVVCAYVAECGDGPSDWLLSLVDADSAPTAVAPSLLTGGPSWLTPEDLALPVAPSSGDSADTGARDPVRDEVGDEDLAGMIPSDAGPNAERVITGVCRELARERKRSADHKRRADKLESKLASTRRSFAAKNRGGGSTAGRYRAPCYMFASDGDRLAYEARRMGFWVYDVWCASFGASERAAKPLPQWKYSDWFFSSLEDVDVPLNKVLRCMVAVLCGIRDRRSAHMLRTGSGSDDSVRRTEAGDAIWRAYVEVGSPQAARLHYARDASGCITFFSVRNHDDMRT